MLIARIPPPIDDLVARALADTPFLAQIAGALPHQVTTYAQISAALAAEQWEAAHHSLIAETLPAELIAATAQALAAHAANLRIQHEAALYAALERVEAMKAALAALNALIAGELPIARAETQMDHAEADLDRVRVALNRAAEELAHAIDAAETAKSDALAAERRALDAAWGTV